MGPPRTGSREGAKYAKQHLNWRRGASPSKGPAVLKTQRAFFATTRCLLRSCVHFSCGLRALPRSPQRSKLCRPLSLPGATAPFVHFGRIDSASLAEAAQWAWASGERHEFASDVQCQVGLNDLATASALHSSVSNAIFCASMTSPGTSGWSGTKHQPALGRPDWSSS
jgi:hypothetical protein